MCFRPFWIKWWNPKGVLFPSLESTPINMLIVHLAINIQKHIKSVNNLKMHGVTFSTIFSQATRDPRYEPQCFYSYAWRCLQLVQMKIPDGHEFLRGLHQFRHKIVQFLHRAHNQFLHKSVSTQGSKISFDTSHYRHHKVICAETDLCQKWLTFY